MECLRSSGMEAKREEIRATCMSQNLSLTGDTIRTILTTAANTFKADALLGVKGVTD